MAKINGVYKGWSGKMGNTVFSMWKNQQIVRSLNIPSNPQSDNQISVRNKIAFLASIGSPLLDTWIKRYWNDIAKGNRSGWNEFVSRNYSGVTVDDISTIIFSRGSLLPVVGLSATYTPSTGVIELKWVDNGNGSSLLSDNEHKTLFDEEEVQFDSIDTANKRFDEGSTMDYITGLDPTDWKIAFCFENSYQVGQTDKYLCSNSVVVSVTNTEA